MKFLLLVIVCFFVLSCSDESKRNDILNRAGELELAWGSLDTECSGLLDTMKNVINLWVNDSLPDSIPKPDMRAFMRSDSLKKILTVSVTDLQNQFVAYEKKVIDVKNNLLSFLSWKLLVNNKDIETETASNDLKKHKSLFKSLSETVRKAFRVNSSRLTSFRTFIQAVNKAALIDTLQNEQP